MSLSRVRIAHVVVQPVLVIDDGDDLSPGPEVRPLTVPLSGLAGVADQLRGEVAKLTMKLHQEQAPAAHPTEVPVITEVGPRTDLT